MSEIMCMLLIRPAMRRCLCSCSSVLMLVLLVVSVLLSPVVATPAVFAQTTDPHGRASEKTVTPDPLTALPSDTGKILRGYADFAHYTPGMCRETMRSLTYRLRRSWVNDTIARAARLFDTVSQAAVRTGTTCAARFTAATVPPRELLNLQHLALSIGNDSLARTVETRRLSLARRMTDSATILRQSVHALLTERPIRIEEAQVAVGRLERLGIRVGAITLEAQEELLRELTTVFDVPALKRVATSMLSISARLPSRERDDAARTIYSAWLGYLRSLQWESPDSLPTVGLRMMQDLSALQGGGFRDPRMGWQQLYATQVFPRIGNPLEPFGRELQYSLPASPAAELRLGQLPKGSVHLVYFVGSSESMDFGLLHRMHARYGQQGLSITVVAGTKGYTQWNGSSVLTPQEEAASLHTLVTEHMRLPATFLLEDIPSTMLPDGRKTYAPSQWYVRLPTTYAIVGRDGVVQMALFGDGLEERELEAYVRRALGIK